MLRLPCRKWTQEEVADLANRPLSHQPNTNKQYMTMVRVLEVGICRVYSLVYQILAHILQTRLSSM
jgi:hypothetical protein